MRPLPALVAAFALAGACLLAGAAPQIESAGPGSFDVTIQGQVIHPGKFSITPDYTVIDAIDMSGGFTAQALRSKVTVIRRAKDGGKDETTVLDYTDNPPNPSNADFKLQAGDVIYVPADPTYGK